MNRTFRLIRAELRKIFLRPTIFILTGILIVILFVSSFFFAPESRVMNKTNITGSTVDIIIGSFLTNANESLDSEPTLRAELTKIEDTLNKYINLTQDNAYNRLKSEIAEFKNYHTTLVSQFTQITLTLNQAFNLLDTLRAKNEAIRNRVRALENDITHYLKQSTYDEFIRITSNLNNLIPIKTASNYNIESLKAHFNENIAGKDFVTQLEKTFEEITPIELQKATFEDIKTDYLSLTSATKKKLDKIRNEIIDFRVISNQSGEGNKVENINIALGYFSDFKSTVIRTIDAIKVRIKFALAGNKTDTELRTYIGFEDFNRYQYQNQLTLNNYFINSDIPEMEFLYAFDFNVSSGTNSGTWDFVYFSLEIIAIFIVLICVYLASYMIAGEYNSGTMKMLAIRPYSRNKILISKLFATLIFMLFFLVLSVIISFVIGFLLIGGFTWANVILVFNATTPIVMNPVIVILLNLLSVMTKIFTFISLAFMIAVLSRSQVGAIIVTAATYVLTLLGNALLASYNWYKFLPFGHLDIFNYFKVTTISSIFSAPLTTTFLLGFIYLCSMILVFNVTSFVFFKRNDIV